MGGHIPGEFGFSATWRAVNNKGRRNANPVTQESVRTLYESEEFMHGLPLILFKENFGIFWFYGFFICKIKTGFIINRKLPILTKFCKTNLIGIQLTNGSSKSICGLQVSSGLQLFSELSNVCDNLVAIRFHSTIYDFQYFEHVLHRFL